MFTVKANLYKKYYPVRTRWKIHEILQYDRGRILKLSYEYLEFIHSELLREHKCLEEFYEKGFGELKSTNLRKRFDYLPKIEDTEKKVKQLEDEYSYARNLEAKIASMQLDTITIEDMNRLLAYEYFVGTERYCRLLEYVIALAFLLFVSWFALKSCVL